MKSRKLEHTNFSLRLPKVVGANLGLSQKPTFLSNVAGNQISRDVAEQQGRSEAAWRHALTLRAPSEHLIEFSHDKIPVLFPTFFSHPLGAQRGFICLLGLRAMRRERQGA